MLTKAEVEFISTIKPAELSEFGLKNLCRLALERLALEPREWRPVKGRESSYLVSNDGEIKTIKGDQVGQWTSDQGYKRAYLENPPQTVRVHRLVAEAFIPKPDDKNGVNHIDCDRANNNVLNLEWSTQAENLEHMTSLYRRFVPPKGMLAGLNNPRCKLTKEKCIEIEKLRLSGLSFEAISKQMKCSKRTVQRVMKNPEEWGLGNIPTAYDSHDWGKIGSFTVCKNCCCLNTSKKSKTHCKPSGALRSMEKHYPLSALPKVPHDK